MGTRIGRVASPDADEADFFSEEMQK